MNWLDVVILGAVALGVLFGAQRGILRQLLLMAAFYASLIGAARYYAVASTFFVRHVPTADPTVASAYTLAIMTAGGTLALGWLTHLVYGSTSLRTVPLVDRLAGAGLGAAWSWAVMVFTVTVLIYTLSFSWGAQEPLRMQLGRAADSSQLVHVARATIPGLREALLPWLPNGLPTAFSA